MSRRRFFTWKNCSSLMPISFRRYSCLLKTLIAPQYRHSHWQSAKTFGLSKPWDVSAVGNMCHLDRVLTVGRTPAAEDAWLEEVRDGMVEKEKMKKSNGGLRRNQFYRLALRQRLEVRTAQLLHFNLSGSIRSKFPDVIEGFEKFVKVQRNSVCASYIGRTGVGPRF